MTVLALECSTSSAKAMLHHSEHGILAVTQHRYTDNGDITALDMEGVWRDAAAAVREVLAGSIMPEGLALCTIWHSFLPETEAFVPLSPLYTWANTQAAEEAAEVRQDTVKAEALYRATGCPPHSMYPYYQLRHWNRSHRPPQRVEGMAAWLFRRLTGISAVSRNTASGSGLMGLDGNWRPAALHACSLTPEQMPLLLEPEESCPLCAEAAAELGLPEGLPVFPGGGDGGLTQIGGGLPVTLSVGTSGAVRMETKIPIFTQPAQTWCYRLWQGRYIAGAATSGAGNCVDWLTELMGLTSSDWNNAFACDRAHAPLFLPFLWGERSPGFRDTLQGGFLGLTGHTDRNQLLYAIMEGVLFHLYDCASRLPSAEAPILLTGGITQNPGWRQQAADLFGCAMVCMPGEHTSLLGAAAIAHAGLHHTVNEQPRSLLQPQSHPELADRFARYRTAAENWQY